MFKNKLFLYGLGLGLIISALLLQLLSYSEMEQATAEEDIGLNFVFKDNLDELKSLAQENGYQLIETNGKNISFDNKKDEVKIDEKNDVDSVQTEDLVEADVEEKESEKITQIRSFSILAGMGSNEVAKQLIQLGLIKDDIIFKQMMNEQDLHSKIQIGDYLFEGQPDINEIITKITNS